MKFIWRWRAWAAWSFLRVLIARRPEVAAEVVSRSAGELARGTVWSETVKERAADALVEGGGR